MAGRWPLRGPCSESTALTTIHTVAQTGSTNADMLQAAAGGADEGWWLRAERQDAGRGRQGREWASPPGNAYASTLVRLRVTDPSASTLALLAAVATQDAIATFTAGEVAAPVIKWPNDLLVNGEKVAGILLERAGDVVVAGIGVNLAFFPELAERPATSLAAHGVIVDPDIFVEVLAAAFAGWLARWRAEGVGSVRQRWLDHAHPIGTALRVRLANGTFLDGLFEGLDTGGALILRLAGKERHVIHAGDVFLL